MSLRLVDSWTGGTAHQVEYRVLESPDGVRRLEVKGPYDAEFHPPARGHATALALRLMNLRTEIPEAGKADVLAMREKSA